MPGIRLHTGSDLLVEQSVRSTGGDLFFRDANGAEFRLITTPDDPEILNKGDGRFHPVDEATALEALADIPVEFLKSIQIDIYLLPYPRSGLLSSSADSRAIYLSPGVRPYEPWQIHFLLAHELGHAVQRRFLPDSDREGWRDYATLRGIADTTRFSELAPHADRPHEVFAEDFRVLFGGSLARRDGTVENSRLVPPETVPQLREFYLSLVDGDLAGAFSGWRVGPNPMRGAQVLTLFAADGAAGAGVSRVSLFDVQGRRVGDLEAARQGLGRWTLALSSLAGTRAGGAPGPAGAFWLCVWTEDGTAPAVQMPLRWLP